MLCFKKNNRTLATLHTTVLLIVLFCVGLVLTGKGIYIFLKAGLAQFLLEKSWEKTLDGEKDIKPWPWADFRPVACLEFSDQEYKVIVVNSASGTSLAFAPGHLDGSAALGSNGNVVIFGHRETHFSVLQHIKTGRVP